MLRFPYADEPLTGPPPPSLPGNAIQFWRPLVPITMIGPTGQYRDFIRAVLDPAADDTIFPIDAARRLGIKLRPHAGYAVRWRGQLHPLRYGDVELMLAESGSVWRWPAVIAFSPAPMRYPILGQAGCLQFFDARFLARISPLNLMSIRPIAARKHSGMAASRFLEILRLMLMGMHWTDLVDLKCWTPLRSVCNDPIWIGESLFQIGPDQFVLAQSYDSGFRIGLPDAPFVTMAIWAATVDAARRTSLQGHHVEVAIPGYPPRELLLGTFGTYAELVRTESVRSHGRTPEVAKYSGVGAFIHKEIIAGKFTYCFVDLHIRDDEIPYAIEIRLP